MSVVREGNFTSKLKLPNSSAMIGVIVSTVALLTGAAIVKIPVVAWAVVGTLMGVLFLQAPPHRWVSGAVVAAVFSRLLVATGCFPPAANFFHFPLALGAAFVAGRTSTPHCSVARFTAMGLMGLLLLSLASWAANGGELLRPFLTWLVFSEPFLIIYALLKAPPPLRQSSFLWKLGFTVSFVQFPLAIRQAVVLGLGDLVQGTFVNMGAGAHVAGGVALIGTLVCVAKGLFAKSPMARQGWYFVSILLFIVPVLSDAKQAIFAFLAGLILLLLASARLRWTRVVTALPILVAGVLGSFSYYRPLRVVSDWALISRGMLGKVEGLSVITSKAADTPDAWLFGFGPGNSVSRVALMGMEGYVNPDSPVYLLGLHAAPTTQEIWRSTSSHWLFASSSVWSGISSWLGLFGDLGLVGLGLYLCLGWKLLQACRGRRLWEACVARAVLIMAAVLGATYSWFEEPGFTLLSALVVGLGVVASRREGVSVKDPDRS